MIVHALWLRGTMPEKITVVVKFIDIVNEGTFPVASWDYGFRTWP